MFARILSSRDAFPPQTDSPKFRCLVAYNFIPIFLFKKKSKKHEDLFLLLQPLRWCCVDCVIHHERDVREE